MRALVAAALLAAAAALGPTLAQDAPAAAPRELRSGEGVVTVVTAAGEHPFTVEIADDPVERSRGLMFRESMARDHGMLFDFGREGPRSFWMRNTPLPLDIIFARGDGTVVSVAENTTPFSEDPIPSEGDARFVLEVNAGVADAISLAPGDRLVHPRITR